jgi:hypothetical protein
MGNVFAHNVPLIHARRCKGVGWLIKNEQQRKQKKKKKNCEQPKRGKTKRKGDPEQRQDLGTEGGKKIQETERGGRQKKPQNRRRKKPRKNWGKEAETQTEKKN